MVSGKQKISPRNGLHCQDARFPILNLPCPDRRYISVPSPPTSSCIPRPGPNDAPPRGAGGDARRSAPGCVRSLLGGVSEGRRLSRIFAFVDHIQPRGEPAALRDDARSRALAPTLPTPTPRASSCSLSMRSRLRTKPRARSVSSARVVWCSWVSNPRCRRYSSRALRGR